jgi:hypothetical protein
MMLLSGHRRMRETPAWRNNHSTRASYRATRLAHHTERPLQEDHTDFSDLRWCYNKTTPTSATMMRACIRLVFPLKTQEAYVNACTVNTFIYKQPSYTSLSPHRPDPSRKNPSSRGSLKRSSEQYLGSLKRTLKQNQRSLSPHTLVV